MLEEKKYAEQITYNAEESLNRVYFSPARMKHEYLETCLRDFYD